MKEMSGCELQARLSVPVIFITFRDDAVTPARIEQSGAAGHLLKPFDDQAMLRVIRRATGFGAAAIDTPSELRRDD